MSASFATVSNVPHCSADNGTDHATRAAAGDRVSHRKPQRLGQLRQLRQTNGVSSFQNVAPTNLRDVERQQIIGALEKTGWHRGKTAELLGISPSTLYRRLREYDLDVR